MIISDPAHTAECAVRASGADVAVVGDQTTGLNDSVSVYAPVTGVEVAELAMITYVPAFSCRTSSASRLPPLSSSS